MKKSFSSTLAFSRNTGWLTELEQLHLRSKRIAIAGMGGVGGFHLLTLTRLGLEKFNIADFDDFEVENFNRQIGATLSSVGKSKVNTLANMAKEINPNSDINCFGEIDISNIDVFLNGVDLYIDGLDFFALNARELIFESCQKRNIPIITAAPIGMGSNYLIFDGTVDFRDYFNWSDQPPNEKLINFFIGLTPKPLHLKYLVDPSKINFSEHRGPSTVIGCQICASVTGAEAIKILLNRGVIYPVPYVHQFDAYRNKYKRSYIWFGNKNPIQKLKIKLAKKLVLNNDESHRDTKPKTNSSIEKILDIARWAPSGDNLQPWRFDIKNNHEFWIIPHVDLKDDIYDFDLKPTWISIGHLMKCIELAANQFNKKISWSIVNDKIKVELSTTTKNNDKENLAPFIKLRSVCRSHYHKKRIPPSVQDNLNKILPSRFTSEIIEKNPEKQKIIQMNMLSTQVRLLIEDFHRSHCHMLQWTDQNAAYGIPYTATGLNRFSATLFKHFHNNWKLIHFFNRYLASSFLSSIELDKIPGKNSAGFLVLKSSISLDSASKQQLIDIGIQQQALWLLLTKHNIALQPCYTPIILNYYHRQEKRISEEPYIVKKLEKLYALYQELGFDDKTLFIARVGYQKDPKIRTRSTRLALSDLIL